MCPQFLILNVSLFEYLEYSRIFKEREREISYQKLRTHNRHTNKQTQKFKKLKICPTPTKVSDQLTKMTGS